MWLKVSSRGCRTRGGALAAAALAMLLSVAPAREAAAAPILSIDPPSVTVEVGSTFFLRILIEDVIDLYAYDIGVGYDPAVVQALAVVKGPFLGAGTLFFSSIDNGAGEATATETLIGPVPGVSGDGQLFRIRFSATAVGVSDIPFTFADLEDSNGDPIVPSDLLPGRVTVIPAVPEPAALGLLVCGLAALARRRRAARRTSVRQVAAPAGLRAASRSASAAIRS